MSRRRKNSDISVPLPVSMSSTDSYTDAIKIIVKPKNDEQQLMMDTIINNVITFIKGPPGCGKTFLSVSHALQEMLKGKYESIIFTRPVMEVSGERLGFLPGDMHEKINPYMMPIFESLSQLITHEKIQKLTSKNGRDAVIRILPLAYMRGVSFRNSFIVADESQNMTVEQMRMLLTRIGENCKMIICGDVNQSDIKFINGLEDAFSLLQGIKGIGFVNLTKQSIVRHPIIEMIEQKYEDRKTKKRNA